MFNCIQVERFNRSAHILLLESHTCHTGWILYFLGRMMMVQLQAFFISRMVMFLFTDASTGNTRTPSGAIHANEMLPPTHIGGIHSSAGLRSGMVGGPGQSDWRKDGRPVILQKKGSRPLFCGVGPFSDSNPLFLTTQISLQVPLSNRFATDGQLMVRVVPGES